MKRNEEARNWGLTVVILIITAAAMFSIVFGAVKFFGGTENKTQQDLTPQELYVNGFMAGQKIHAFELLVLDALSEQAITETEADELIELSSRLIEIIAEEGEISKRTSAKFNKALKKVCTVQLYQERLTMKTEKIEPRGLQDSLTWNLFNYAMELNLEMELISEEVFEEYSKTQTEYYKRFSEDPNHELALEFFEYASNLMLDELKVPGTHDPIQPSIEGAPMGAFTLCK